MSKDSVLLITQWVERLLSLVDIIDPESEVSHLEKQVHKLQHHLNPHSTFRVQHVVVSALISFRALETNAALSDGAASN